MGLPIVWVPLDVRWADNPKVIEAGLDGAGLHAVAMCLAKYLETDGILYRSQLTRRGASDELIDRLVEIGLFDPVDDRRVSVHDWLDVNASIAKIANVRSASGRLGNHKRWGHKGPLETCEMCSQTDRKHSEDVQVDVANSQVRVANASQTVANVARDRDIDRENVSTSSYNLGGSDTPEPPTRCANHAAVKGFVAEPCTACRDARIAHDAWKARQRPPNPLEGQAQAARARAEAGAAQLKAVANIEPAPMPDNLRDHLRAVPNTEDDQ